tara:strand:- start:106 stop:1410 length:1305 start_codon:yes stop_codon:yes gene_type:complete
LKEKIIKKINSKTATISIVGLGYVGLPLVLAFSDSGYKVIGIDIDDQKVKKLNRGESYIENIESSRINKARERGFKATSDFGSVEEADVLILCVPTPLTKNKEPDTSYIYNTLDSILPFIKKGQALSLESTTYPGTTEEILAPKIEEKKLEIGNDFFLIYSPEREDPGNHKYNTYNIPKIVGGHKDNCLEVGSAIYQSIIETVIPVSSTKVAEMTKLLENIYRAVNIGLVNEMKVVADKMGMDIYEIIEAASSKPFGYTPYYPGPGLGGHCIPIDPFYLSWKAKEYNIHTRFIELAGEVNAEMPKWVLSKICDSLNNLGKSINGSKILILGIAYKKDIDDTRESPAIELIRLLKDRKANVEYSDPFVSHFPKKRNFNYDLVSTELNDITLSSFDVVVLATDHSGFDYNLIASSAKMIIDCRGIYRKLQDNIIRG